MLDLGDNIGLKSPPPSKNKWYPCNLDGTHATCIVPMQNVSYPCKFYRTHAKCMTPMQVLWYPCKMYRTYASSMVLMQNVWYPCSKSANYEIVAKQSPKSIWAVFEKTAFEVAPQTFHPSPSVDWSRRRSVRRNTTSSKSTDLKIKSSTQLPHVTDWMVNVLFSAFSQPR